MQAFAPVTTSVPPPMQRTMPIPTAFQRRRSKFADASHGSASASAFPHVAPEVVNVPAPPLSTTTQEAADNLVPAMLGEPDDPASPIPNGNTPSADADAAPSVPENVDDLFGGEDSDDDDFEGEHPDSMIATSPETDYLSCDEPPAEFSDETGSSDSFDEEMLSDDSREPLDQAPPKKKKKAPAAKKSAPIARAAASAGREKSSSAGNDLAKLTVPELKNMAKEMGIKVTGMRTKTALLLAFGAADPPAPPPASERTRPAAAKPAARKAESPQPLGKPASAKTAQRAPATKATATQRAPATKATAAEKAPAPEKAPANKETTADKSPAKSKHHNMLHPKPAASRKRGAQSALTRPDWTKHRRLHERLLDLRPSDQQQRTFNERLGNKEITLRVRDMPAFLALADRAELVDALRVDPVYKAHLASAENGDEGMNDFLANSARLQGVLGFAMPEVEEAIDLDALIG